MRRLSRWGRLVMPLCLPWRCTDCGGLTCSLLLHSLPWRNSLNGVAHIAWKQVPGWFHSLGFFREASFPLFYIYFSFPLFFSPLFSLQFLPWFAWKQCFRRFGFSTNAWEHHVIIMPVASRNRSIGRATHKVLSPLSTVVLVEPRQTCHLTTFALKVYGQIGHWSGTQWGEVKKVLCRCPDVLFTWQFTCNRIRSWVKERHFQYAMLFMPANCNDIECKVCPFPMTQVMYGHVDFQWLCIEHYRTTQWWPVTFQFHCPLVRRKAP